MGGGKDPGQQIGHGHALREGRYLDARAHGGCDVEGQASRVEVAFAQRIGVALANPRLGVRIRGRTRADADALCRDILDQTGVVLTPGLDFGVIGAKRFIRVSYATSMANLEEAIKRLRAYLPKR